MNTAPVRRVLLISNSAGEREMYTDSLRRGGFCTLQARTAADAIRLASELPPAAVVTDDRLGEETGLQPARRLREDARMRRVPLVMLTASFTQDREAAARAGCDLFIAKPCLPDALSNVVAGLIDRQP